MVTVEVLVSINKEIERPHEVVESLIGALAIDDDHPGPGPVFSGVRRHTPRPPQLGVGARDVHPQHAHDARPTRRSSRETPRRRPIRPPPLSPGRAAKRGVLPKVCK